MASTNKADLAWCFHYTADAILKDLKVLCESLEEADHSEAHNLMNYFFETALPIHFGTLLDYFNPTKGQQFKELMLTAKATRHHKMMVELEELKNFLEVR